MYSWCLPKLRHGVAICRDCGHIQIHPFFSEEELENINRDFFGKKYLKQGMGNPDNSVKMNKLGDVLKSYIREGIQVLDVGAGESWAYDFFKGKGCHYWAIEPIDKLAKNIRQKGGRVIGKSLSEDYRDYREKFDIIIFRHVLEHLLNPSEALRKVHSLLNPEGVIYLAVPNAEGPFNLFRKGLHTSFFRPVHVSYFCEGNLARLALQVGLEAAYARSDGEIVMVLKKQLGELQRGAYENYFSAHKDHFLRTARVLFRRDSINAIYFFSVSRPEAPAPSAEMDIHK